MNTTTPLARPTRLRSALLVLAGARAVTSVVALLLVPALYDDHFALVVLLRPTKEILLAGGFLLRRGDIALGSLLVAALPLLLLGVWQFYALGRAYGGDLAQGTALPRWSRRILPPERVKQMCQVLDRKGQKVIVAGRLAAFPSSMLGAAAGASGMATRRFLMADSLGAALSLVEVIGAGYLLSEAYEEAGPWITGVGLVVLVGIVVYLGRSLRRT